MRCGTIMEISDFIALLNEDSDDFRIIEILDSSENFIDVVKINTDNWGTSSALNIHIAQYIQAVQKDIISAWNTATGQHVTLSTLDKYPFLIVEFEVKDGCLNIKHIVRLVDILMKDLSAAQKIWICTMLFCGVLAVSTSYTVGKLADSGYFDSDEVKKIKILSQQKESTKVLINNLGNGTVNYQGQNWDSETLKEDRKSVASVPITENISLDGTYTIDTCKLEGDFHLTSNGKNFYADYDALDESKKKILAGRVAEALLQKRKLDQQLRIDAKLRNGSIIKAHIIDIDQPPRPYALDAKSSKDNLPQQSLRQGSLLED